jgi:hypothetical protein
VFAYEAGDETTDWEREAADKAGLYFTAVEPLNNPGTPFPAWTVNPHDVFATLADALRSDGASDPETPGGAI